MIARVLIVAGSDSGAGAGIQADLKTVMALGGYATTAITAVTAQNTRGVSAIHPIPPEIVERQMLDVLDDIGADAVKTGMLFDAAIIERVAAVLRARAAALPIIVDPVMIATSGAVLLPVTAIEALCRSLLPLATVLTPNLPEAAALLDRPIATVEEMRAAALDLCARGPRFVLLKGGHLTGDQLFDVLAGPDGVRVFESRRILSRATHGTGCTLAAAIAAGLAQAATIESAVARARAFVQGAIAHAPGLGSGSGPMNHGWKRISPK